MSMITHTRFFVLLLILFACNSLGVAKSIDSLKIELAKHKNPSKTRVEILYDLAAVEHLQNGNNLTALNYLEEAEQISSRLEYRQGQAKSYYLRGIVRRSKGEYDEADNNLQKALKLYKILRDDEKCAHCHHHLAILNYERGKNKEAIFYFKELIRFMDSIGDETAVTHANNNIGNAYADLGDFEQALFHYKKALTLSQKIGNQELEASSYNNMGTIYLSQQNNPKAFEYFNKSLYLRQSIGDSIGVVYCLNNLGIIYKRQENYDKAIESYSSALKLLSIKKHEKEIAQIKSNLGMVYSHKEDYDKALKLVTESLEINQRINSTNQIAVNLNNIGDIHMRKKLYSKARAYYQEGAKIGTEISAKYRLVNSYMGISRSFLAEKNYDSALVYTLSCKAIANELDLLGHKSDVEDILWQVYSATGQYEKALESHQYFKLYEDSLQNKENIKKMTQLEYEYKYKQELESAGQRELKLNKKVAATTKDLEKSQQNSLIAVIIILLISLVSVIIIFILKLRHARAKNQNILIEQKLLRSQMTPHFIFNSLSVLQGMILNKEEDKSVKYLSEFSKLLRTVLENSRHKSVLLSNELMAIESYMTLQNLDANPPYDYNLSIDPDVNNMQLEIPPMLIQPFIENAIEHAFPHQKENRVINIEIKMEKGLLKCSIEDNGVGITHPVSSNKKNSLATVITSERLEILSKEFKSKGSLDIKNKKLFGKQGTLVTLIIPYKIVLNR